jgi:hypothetical protein
MEFLEKEDRQDRLTIAKELADDINADAERVAEEGYPNSKIRAQDVLMELHDADVSLSSKEIGDKMGYTGISSITGILNRLSETENKLSWIRHPVVEGDAGGWNTTRYGDLVGESLYFIHGEKHEPMSGWNGPVKWIYEWAINPGRLESSRRNKIESALSEIRPEFG